MTDQREIVRTYPSSSNPAKLYTVKKDIEGILYCDCPAWRFQNKATHLRDCRHVKQYVEDRALEVQQGN